MWHVRLAWLGKTYYLCKIPRTTIEDAGKDSFFLNIFPEKALN
jgi:hypothetical protein